MGDRGLEQASISLQVGDGDLVDNKVENKDQRDIDVVEEVKKANVPPDGYE